MRFAVYVRVSTEDQVRGYSLSEQKESCKQKAFELGASEEDITVYADEGVSGSLMERPGLTALREAVKRGEVDCIIVRDPDRLSRKLSHQLVLTEEFEKAGVKLEFLNFDWKDTPEGRLFYSVRGAIAEYEKEKIRERTSLGKIQKAREGGVPVGFNTYGYDYNPETGKITINEREAEVVREIFRLFIEEDRGANGIARYLNDKDVPTKTRKAKWHRQVIIQILSNTTYMGVWYYRKRKCEGNKFETRDKKDWIPINVPAIIDKQTFIRAQEKLAEARRLWASKGTKNYLLSGIISCGDCGNTMTGVYANWWGRKERRYTCAKPTQGTKNVGCRPRKMILASLIEDAVWEQVKQWVFDPEGVAEEASRCRPDAENLKKELKKVDKLLNEAMKGRDNILSTLASGLVDLDEKTEAMLSELKRRIARLEARKGELIDGINGEENLKYRAEEIKKITADFLDRLDDLSFEEKKELVRLLVKQVVIHGRQTHGNKWGNIEITVVAKLGGGE